MVFGRIVTRVAREMKDGDYATWASMPTIVANHIRRECRSTALARTGSSAWAYTATPTSPHCHEEEPTVTELPDRLFSMRHSFARCAAAHRPTVRGALQVDQEETSHWRSPRNVKGMGGARTGGRRERVVIAGAPTGTGAQDPESWHAAV